ncbi:MAG: 2Fe-2S iron-sulfur cluster binding domain-containing protein [Caldiserica bacterium]|nr:2Fe-2S iron-sulfur cluster binding domain-containing protein [Caldisericota bacterium]
MKSFYTVKFLPENKEIRVVEGTSLLFAAIKAGITINTPCGGKGICGKCRALVTPAPLPTPQEKKILSEEEIGKGWRLSCQHQVNANLNVEIPSSSRYFRQAILTKIQGGKISLSPPVKRVSFPIPSLSLGERSIGEKVLPPQLAIDLYSLRHLAQSFKKGRAFASVINAHQVLEVNQESRLFGIAFDIGTTTVVGYLVNLETGEMLDVHAITNPQVIYGDDVISRIEYASREDGLKNLSQAILAGVNTIIKELCKKNHLSPEEKKFLR